MMGGDHRVDAHALAASRGPGNQQVRHTGKVGHGGLAAALGAQHQRQLGAFQHGPVLVRLHDVSQVDHRGSWVWHLDSHERRAGNGRLDPQARHREGQCKVLLPRQYVVDLHTCCALGATARGPTGVLVRRLSGAAPRLTIAPDPPRHEAEHGHHRARLHLRHANLYAVVAPAWSR